MIARDLGPYYCEPIPDSGVSDDYGDHRILSDWVEDMIAVKPVQSAIYAPLPE